MKTTTDHGRPNGHKIKSKIQKRNSLFGLLAADEFDCSCAKLIALRPEIEEEPR